MFFIACGNPDPALDASTGDVLVVDDAEVTVDAQTDVGVSDAIDSEPDAPVFVGPTTDELLAEFYGIHGGRTAFPPSYVDAIEALLKAEDEVVQGDYASARARIDAILAMYPLSDPVWWTGAGQDGTNVGRPVGYYGLRMLDEIARVGLTEAPASTKTIRMTVAVVACAQGRRPTNVELTESEAVDLTLHPALEENEHAIIRQSLRLFQHYVSAITDRALTLEVVFERVETCATVTFSENAFSGLTADYTTPILTLPNEVREKTDMWWLIYPSNVPDAAIFDDTTFVTGGMGRLASAPVFISDDLWLVRKPPHLGTGVMTGLERRVYLPQWLQHEFFHHLFSTWSTFGLEAEGHQWFNRITWPEDFVGQWEPDYYAEALKRRLRSATPSLTEGLQVAIGSIDLSGLTPMDFVGSYRSEPVQNPWHEVTVSAAGDALLWSNAAGVSWSMSLSANGLRSGPDCPYGEMLLGVVQDQNSILGLRFNGGLYTRQ